jgi:putative ABC transport system permease protein
VAGDLGIGIGDEVEVTIRRRSSNREELATTRCQVVSILEQIAEETAIGYADFDLLDKFEQWIRGYRVAEFDWPASAAQVGPRYREYLLFLEGSGARLSESDQRALDDRGFAVSDEIDDIERTLGGCIARDTTESLTVLKLRPHGSTPDKPVWMNISAAELESFTEADDVIVPWNGARAAGDGLTTLVGVSLKKRSWLRSYLFRPDIAFDFTVDGVFFMPDGSAAPVVELKGGSKILLRPHERDEGGPGEPAQASADPGGRHVIVPVQFLARLFAFDCGLADFDNVTQAFVPVSEPSVYGKARLFARTIDDVPGVVAALVGRRFAVISESGRISEIHEQDNSLQLLVVVVGLGVFLFGILTVLSVLIDSTDRKRGVIGILRVMGVSRGGIFLLVLLRAAAIGVLAGAVAATAGWAIGCVLAWEIPANSFMAGWKPDITIHIHPYDVALVMVGAVACAAIGAILPAWKAAKLDPFDAIVEGRFT